MASRWPQWWREEKLARYLDRQRVMAEMRERRRLFWAGVYLGWSVLGWIVIFAHMAGIG
jgi:hypothetical protein